MAGLVAVKVDGDAIHWDVSTVRNHFAVLIPPELLNRQLAAFVGHIQFRRGVILIYGYLCLCRDTDCVVANSFLISILCGLAVIVHPDKEVFLIRLTVATRRVCLLQLVQGRSVDGYIVFFSNVKA